MSLNTTKPADASTEKNKSHNIGNCNGRIRLSRKIQYVENST